MALRRWILYKWIEKNQISQINFGLKKQLNFCIPNRIGLFNFASKMPINRLVIFSLMRCSTQVISELLLCSHKTIWLVHFFKSKYLEMGLSSYLASLPCCSPRWMSKVLNGLGNPKGYSNQGRLVFWLICQEAKTPK